MDDFNEVDFDNINLDLESNLGNSQGEDNFIFTQEIPSSSFQNYERLPFSQISKAADSRTIKKGSGDCSASLTPSSHGLTPSIVQSQGPQNTQGSLADATNKTSQNSFSNQNDGKSQRDSHGQISNELSQAEYSKFKWDFDAIAKEVIEKNKEISTNESEPFQETSSKENYEGGSIPKEGMTQRGELNLRTIPSNENSRYFQENEKKSPWSSTKTTNDKGNPEQNQLKGRRHGKLVPLSSLGTQETASVFNSSLQKPGDGTQFSMPKKKMLTLSELSRYKTMKTMNCGPPAGAQINRKEARKWEYLLHRDFREYQFKIVECCLFFNTIVGLPTGLGKTFIAVNVIQNYYRWFEDGKIFFLAPTKPLVTQQLTACMEIDVFNSSELMELTGDTSAEERKTAYENGRIFFMTPQTLENDIKNKKIDLNPVVLVIYDEAHRATGSYAYCEIQKALDRKNSGTRIISLTATPGNDLDQVKEVVRNVRASKMFVKDEHDDDVAPYLHNKKIEIMQIPANGIISSLEEKVNSVLEKLAFIITKCLHPEEVPLMPVKAPQITYETVKKASDAFQSKIHHYFQMSGPELIIRLFEGFSLVYSVIHVRKALLDQGYKSFVNLLKNFAQNTSKKNGTPNYLKLEMLKSWPEVRFLNSVVQNSKNSIHPKLIRLGDLLEKYFEKAYRKAEEKGTQNSRVLVFTQSRASAVEIEAYLKFRVVKSKPKVFLGQGDREASKGMSQKEQLMTISHFKKGRINTLVATCVAEEGLDIGEVDLVVCFDSGLTPIRLVQRMGRTGRKRDGKVILLLMDKEYEQFMATEAQRKRITAQLQKLCGVRLDTGSNISHNELGFYSFNPRMLPDEIQPQLQLCYPKKQSNVGSFAVYSTNSSVNSTVNCLTIIQQEKEKEEKLKNGKEEEEQFGLDDFNLEEFESSLKDYIKEGSHTQITKKITENSSKEPKLQRESQTHQPLSRPLCPPLKNSAPPKPIPTKEILKEEPMEPQYDLSFDLKELNGLEQDFENQLGESMEDIQIDFPGAEASFEDFEISLSQKRIEHTLENHENIQPNSQSENLMLSSSGFTREVNHPSLPENPKMGRTIDPMYLEKETKEKIGDHTIENVKLENTEMVLEGLGETPKQPSKTTKYWEESSMKIFDGNSKSLGKEEGNGNRVSFEIKAGIEISMKKDGDLPPEINYNIPELEMMASGNFNAIFAERQRGIRKIRADNPHAVYVNPFEISNSHQ